MLSRLFDSLFLMLFKRFTPFKFVEPKRGVELSDHEKNELINLRKNVYSQCSPHLLDQSIIESEAKYQFDERSWHFLVYEKQELVAALRLTPSPYEIDLYTDKLNRSDYLEISRLVVSKEKAGALKLLLIYAGVYSVTKLKMKGFVGFCTSKNLQLFKSFGMKVVEKLGVVSERSPFPYFVIESSFNDLRSSVIEYLGQKLLGKKMKQLKRLLPVSLILILTFFSLKAYSQTVLEQKVSNTFACENAHREESGNELIKTISGNVSDYIEKVDGINHKYDDSLFTKQISDISKTQNSIGNEVELFTNGDLLQEKIKILKKSRRFYWVATMLIRCDKSTQVFISELERAVKRGVDVRIIVDYLADLTAGFECTKKLDKLGVKVLRSKYSLKTAYKELADLKDHKFSNAFHGKLWIADGEYGIIDSTNINNLHHNSNGVNYGYRDTGIKIKGPIVTDMTLDYVKLWKNINGKIDHAMKMRDIFARLDRTEEYNNNLRGDSISSLSDKPSCRYISQGKHTNQHVLGNIYTKYINMAQEHIILTPLEYLFDFNKTHESYQDFYRTLSLKSRMDKVKVDVLVNYLNAPWTPYERNPKEFENFNDSHLSKKILEGYKEFLPDGQIALEKYAYDQYEATHGKTVFWAYSQFNHSKVMLIDQYVSIIGTHNMNPRSFTSDFEMAVICHDKKLADKLLVELVTDLVNSTPIIKTQ